MLYGSAGGSPGSYDPSTSRPPHLLERHPPDEFLDVDAAIAQRRAFLVWLGDLGFEGDDAFQAVLDLGHVDSLVSER